MYALLSRRLVIVGAFAVACTTGMNSPAQVSATSGGQPADVRAHAANAATTSELFLCIGPTTACPSTGAVSPPPSYQPMLAMQFGQTWNGTMDAYANDGSVITGTISLLDSYNGGPSQTLCTLSVAAGGTCPASVGTTVGTAVGTHVLTSVYSGDATHASSVSASVTIIVSQETTSATLTATPNPAIAGQPVTLTATIAGAYAPPSGTVTFLYAGTVIGTASLTASGINATAAITTSTLTVGQDTITAVYASTTNFTSATATAMETITPAPAGNFSLSVMPSAVSIGVGGSAILNVAVTPSSGFAQDVSLSCADLPPEATCTFASPTIAGGNGATSLIVQTTAPHTCGTTAPYFLGSDSSIPLPRAPIGIAIAGFLVLWTPRWRARWLKFLIALFAITGATQLTGCGNCTDLGTRPSTYTIEVTGTATQSGTTPATASQAVKITVTI